MTKETDRELLELAAKAAGIEIYSWESNCPLITRSDGQIIEWQPLADDGDALRLAVKLGLTICNEHESCGMVYCTDSYDHELPVEYSGNIGDPPGITPTDYAATRRAIVRAAAEIGRAMP